MAFCVLCIGLWPALLFLSCAGKGIGSIPPSADPPPFPEDCIAGWEISLDISSLPAAPDAAGSIVEPLSFPFPLVLPPADSTPFSV